MWPLYNLNLADNKDNFDPLLVGWRNRRGEPRVDTIDPQMTFILTKTTQNRARTITGLVAETLTIKTNTVGTDITKVTGTITFTTRRNLTTMLYKHLELTKPEEAGDRFRNPYAVMSETIVDIWGQRMLAPTVVQNFAIR